MIFLCRVGISITKRPILANIWLDLRSREYEFRHGDGYNELLAIGDRDVNANQERFKAC
jgi:hypothetical protein